MSTDDKMPPQPKTIELPAMTDRALLEDLRRVVKDGFAQVDGRLDKVVESQVDLNTRVDRIEVRIEKVEARQDNGSLRVRQESDVNLKQDAAMAMVITKVDRLEESQAAQTEKLVVIEQKTDTQTVLLNEAKDAAKRLWAHPAVKLLLSAIWGWVLYELGKRGIDVPK